jgi:hypothetical protein
VPVSLERIVREFDDVVVMANSSGAPLRVSDVTSSDNHCPARVGPDVAMTPPTVGFVFHVVLASDQAEVTGRAATPVSESLSLKTSTTALRTGAGSAGTTKRTYDSARGDPSERRESEAPDGVVGKSSRTEVSAEATS